MHAAQAIAVGAKLSHPFSQAWALSWTAALHQLSREVEKTRERADADLAMADEQVIPFFGAHAMVLRGWAMVERGQQGDGLAEIRRGLVAYRATGAEIERPHWLALMAEACMRSGRMEEGFRIVGEALEHSTQTGIEYYDSELHRLEGELRLRLDPVDAQQAEANFRRALEIAQRQQAKSWELRAATSLARLWGEQGRRAEGRELLAPVYAWFTEGLDTADLKEAKAL